MVRQCAWCLCLIDDEGERLSPSPWPKLYEATHGICGVCGVQWMEQVVADDRVQATASKQDYEENNATIFAEVGPQGQQERQDTLIQLVLELQQQATDIPSLSDPKPIKKTQSH